VTTFIRFAFYGCIPLTVKFLSANMFSTESTSISVTSCLIMAYSIASVEVLSKDLSISKKLPMAYPLCLYLHIAHEVL